MAWLPADDAALWRRATQDVAPLGSRRATARELPRPVAAAPPPAAARPAPPPPAAAPALDRFAGLDRASADRLKRGRYQVDSRLDLHGMTQDEAHRALTRFVVGARTAGHRCVLVITGHGRTSGGILKAAVPRWLDEPGLRHHLLAIAPARPPHGGAGALYVLLRRVTDRPRPSAPPGRGDVAGGTRRGGQSAA